MTGLPSTLSSVAGTRPHTAAGGVRRLAGGTIGRRWQTADDAAVGASDTSPGREDGTRASDTDVHGATGRQEPRPLAERSSERLLAGHLAGARGRRPGLVEK